MRTLKIETGGRILVGGEFADISQLENKGEFLSSLLTLDVELSDGISVGDLIHFFYDSKDLIKSILSEQYEVVRALVTMANLPNDYTSLRIYKSFKIEKEDGVEFLYMIPEIELVPAAPGEEGIKSLSGLPVIIDENIELVDLESDSTIVQSRTKLSLLDLLICIFEELPALLKEGTLLSH